MEVEAQDQPDVNMQRPENWTRFNTNGLATAIPMELQNGDIVHHTSWYHRTGYEIITPAEERSAFELVGDNANVVGWLNGRMVEWCDGVKEASGGDLLAHKPLVRHHRLV